MVPYYVQIGLMDSVDALGKALDPGLAQHLSASPSLQGFVESTFLGSTPRSIESVTCVGGADDLVISVNKLFR